MISLITQGEYSDFGVLGLLAVPDGVDLEERKRAFLVWWDHGYTEALGALACACRYPERCAKEDARERLREELDRWRRAQGLTPAKDDDDDPPPAPRAAFAWFIRACGCTEVEYDEVHISDRSF